MSEKRSQPIQYSNQEYFLQRLEQYEKDPLSLDPDWRAFFQGMEFAAVGVREGEKSPKEVRLLGLIDAYKRYGHLVADFNPLYESEKNHPQLSLEKWGLSGEVEQLFPTFGYLPEKEAPLGKILKRVQEIYAGKIGFECYNVEDVVLEEWLHERVKTLKSTLSKEEGMFVARELFQAKYLEEFLQRKFLGAKRFSLEGGEAFIPMIQELFFVAAETGYEMGIIGMAHRGRLNVMTNVLKKPYAELFHEFNTNEFPPVYKGMGDVKYHKGYKTKIKTRGGSTIDLLLASNPSHLESVDPVVVGMVKGMEMKSAGKMKILPVLIHGDASVAGQGVVYETMQLSKIEGYGVSGSVHVVINNQLGFTAIPKESRSTRYCTDIAKAFGSPVIHVNGEDPVACLEAARIAFEARDKFNIDVFIDMYCHRLWGHNEADEPRFTNPDIYEKIKQKGDIYQNFMSKNSFLSQKDVEEMEKGFKETLEKALGEAKPFKEEKESEKAKGTVETKVPLEKLKELGEKITLLPKDFSPHAKLSKHLLERKEAIYGKADEKNIDWATAETLAYASLLDQGIHVRLSGQDSKRGTFSHRHAVLVDQTNENPYTPLNHVKKEQPPFSVFSSALSEYAVMGFEFGYSLGWKESLVIWEGQFGDFVNGAQIIIDQYLASSETKWGEKSGLTLFLPHGHEGMGPEHTSCRIERFLQLAGLENWRVCVPTTPAQFFHLLRRQVLSPEKKPLVIATPKSMLRLGPSFSKMEDLGNGAFEEILEEEKPSEVKRLLLCSGKIYYELAKARKEGVWIIRVEQLYPLNRKKLKECIQKAGGVKELFWVQEEPKNQGAFEYIQPYLEEAVEGKIAVHYVGRERNSVPDTGFVARFKKEQEEVINRAVGGK
jgi:2-oxoglutarate dehydrogenase E1 component